MTELSKDRGSLSGQALLDDQAKRMDKSNLRMQNAYHALYETAQVLTAAQEGNNAAQAEWRATIDEREALMDEITGKKTVVPTQWIAEHEEETFPTIEPETAPDTQLGESEK